MNVYQEFPPHPLLAAHVACLWTSRVVPGAAPVQTRVLPDNCIDILWQDCAPQGFVAGMMGQAHRVAFAQPVHTVAVRFLPGAARAFFDLPLHLLQDAHPALPALWPRAEAEALAAALWERAPATAVQLGTIERALLARLRQRTAPPAERLVRAAIAALEGTRGAVRIDDLARRLGVSRQHLGLQFREHVGLNAKTFAMVCRFRHATALLRQGGAAVDWAALALACGYYDQAHLIHAFRLFADETPAAFHFSNTRPPPGGTIVIPPI